MSKAALSTPPTYTNAIAQGEQDELAQCELDVSSLAGLYYLHLASDTTGRVITELTPGTYLVETWLPGDRAFGCAWIATVEQMRDWAFEPTGDKVILWHDFPESRKLVFA